VRTFFVLAICLTSVCAFAETGEDVNKLAEEFSMAMGVDQLLEATLQQTRESVGSSMTDLFADLKSQYPNMSDSEVAALDKILIDCVNSVIDSVDTKRAAALYAKIIAEGMPPAEIEAATEYYSSPEGQQLLQVVGAAASQLNQYILDQMALATKTAQAKMMVDLDALITGVHKNSE